MEALILLRSFQESQIEFWLPIKGFAGYDVSSFGRVRSWWKPGAGGSWNLWGIGRKTPTILRFGKHRQGYEDASLCREGAKRGIMKVHRLVALAFLSNLNNEPTVNHKNLIKADNRLDNLEWKSREGQQEHLAIAGMKVVPVNAGRRLTVEEITLAQTLIGQGLPKAAIAKAVGTSRPTISNIVKAIEEGRSYGSSRRTSL